MSSNTFSSEYLQSELPAIQILQQLGYTYIDWCSLNRDISTVILEDDFLASIQRLNPWIDSSNLSKVLKILTTPKETETLKINQDFLTDFVKWISLPQDLWNWKKNQTVKIFDFQNPQNNTFKVINQFKVRLKEKIWIYEKNIPDIVVFINWIPIWVIECKAPTVENALKKWIEQIQRYHNEIPRLFWYSNINISCAGSSGLLYGTTNTPIQYFQQWKTFYPYETKEQSIEKIKNIDSPTPQDLALFSIFDKDNILDLLQNFTVFEFENQKLIKKICRYQQFQAVRKIAERVIKRDENGWVIWHTQWSWKSLTMLFTALKLKRISQLNNPTIVIITDRNNLDWQISWTFTNAWFENPIHINGKWTSKTQQLMNELKNSQWKTIITTIQSFQSDEEYPLLSDRDDIIVCVDEAHRTQYWLWLNQKWKLWFAGNMRKALPNAFFIAFTWTPIEKSSLQNTKKVFGSYIDTYKISDAVADGATVPIKYELRYATQELDIWNFEDEFNFLFAWFSDEEKKLIRAKYWTKKDLMETPERIKAIVKDIIKHFKEKIAPNWYKWMIVTTSRENCIKYKKFFDELSDIQTLVVISWDNNDSEEMKKFHLTKEQEDWYVGKNWTFHDPQNPIQLLIVKDKLLTWFDSPIVQVMYLDALLQEHTLLQAIARTNRNCTLDMDWQKFKKTYWLVVDYAWIWWYLTKALEMFDNNDISQDEIMIDQNKDISILEEKLEDIKDFFHSSYLTDNNSLEDYLQVFEDEKLRAKFKDKLKSFNETLDELLPNNDLIDKYWKDIRLLTQIAFAVKERFREAKESYALEEAWAKVKKLIDEYVRSFGVKIIVSEVDILDIDFKNRLKQIWTEKWQASELRAQLKNIININIWNENPVLFKSLSEKLNEIIKQVKDWVISIKQELEEYYKIRDKIIETENEKKDLSMKNWEYAIYTFLRDINCDDKEVVKEISDELQKLCVSDWIDKESAIKDISKYLKRELYKLWFENKEQLEIKTNELLEIVKLNYAR